MGNEILKFPIGIFKFPMGNLKNPMGYLYLNFSSLHSLAFLEILFTPFSIKLKDPRPHYHSQLILINGGGGSGKVSSLQKIALKHK